MADSVSLNFSVMGDKELKEALKSITEGLKVNKSEMELVSAAYAKNANSIAALTAKGDVLKKSIASQTDQVRVLEDALKREVQKHGEASSAAMRKTQEYNKAQAAMLRLTQELDKNNQAMQQAATFSEKSKDGTARYAQIMAESAAQMRVYDSELKLIAKSYDDLSGSARKSQETVNVFRKMAEEQSKVVDSLADALQKATDAGMENSDTFKNLQVDYNNAKSALLGYEAQANKAAEKSGRLDDATAKAGDSAQGSTKGIGAMTVALGQLLPRH